MTLVQRGVGVESGGPSGGNTIPLPTGTAIGDLLVVATYRHVCTDARMTQIAGSGVGAILTGIATTLDPISLATVGAAGKTSICAAYAPVTTLAATATSGTGSPAPMPSTSLISALFIGAVTTEHSSSGISPPPDAWVTAAISSFTIGGLRIHHWNGDAGPSPTADLDITVPTGDPAPGWAFVLIPVGTPGAPAARKHPRSDGRGFGSGRIFPPSSTQQAGRLNGPY